MADVIRSTRDFAGDVQDEMTKVTWPDTAQLKSSTTVIVVFLVVVSITIFVMDLVVNQALNLLRSLFGG